MSPLSNSYLDERQTQGMERFYPLHAYVCERCRLVQLLEYEAPEAIFGDYAYFSSYSQSWLDHARDYADYATRRFGYGPRSLVVEIASNDGYLLKNFQARGIPVLGVEPAANVAKVAQQAGIPTEVAFFGVQTAQRLAAQGRQADLLIGNNVLAHVPDLNDFVAGMKILLKRGGVITMEFPHLLRLMEQTQFDTIYHEHFSYLSFSTVVEIFAKHGLAMFDVQELPTHGGSLRIHARHADEAGAPAGANVAKVLGDEKAAGLYSLETYLAFPEKVKALKRDILSFLVEAKRAGKTIAGYGAPAKGNTLLNYCGVRGDFIDYTVDRSPHKQGKFLPGTHIPIHAPERIGETRPDYLFILPWNLKDEIMQQMAHVRSWGCRFVVPIPRVQVLP
jgi:2-polyprenyl-3-methyl-5-hydroxy-6-metoxy-1,4-benzoquinol methylase